MRSNPQRRSRNGQRRVVSSSGIWLRIYPAAVYREPDLDGVGRAGIGQMRLRENMVMGLNVDLHDPAWRRDVGVMLGDMVAVKPGAAEYLCNTPLDLFEVPVNAAAT